MTNNLKPLSRDDLQCLNRWPEATPGAVNDQQLIDQLHRLCIAHGPSQIKQVVSALHEIWLDPTQIAVYHAARQKFLATQQQQQQQQQQGFERKSSEQSHH